LKLAVIDLPACLSAAREGSRDALGAALESHRAYLLALAAAKLDPVLLTKGGASDIVQETFLDAQQAFPRFTGRSEPELRAWLRCLLLHRVAKFGRRYRSTLKRRIANEVTVEANRPADSPTPSACVIADERAEILQTAIDRLPEDHRRVIRLRYQDGRTFEEIGPLMGRTPNAVRLLWLRAIERVKLELRSVEDG
jgi:RNA polymerase sigma-70 factor, ECF subfamily